MKTVRLPIRWRGVHATGLSFSEMERIRKSQETNMFVVNMAMELPGGDIRLEVQDYHTPDDSNLVSLAVLKAYRHALNGEMVFVHCMGGLGRTGLFLAIMAKVSGVSDPIGFVRREYNGHAVETREQMKYVHEFKVDVIRERILQMVRRKMWMPWRDL